MERLRRIFTLSPKVSRCLEISLRTTWAVFLTMLIQHYWKWTSIITYLSPIISVIASVLYFGLWQENSLKVSYAIVIGGGIGTGIGYLYETKIAVALLIFVALGWLSSVPTWDRLMKVMYTLALLLGAIVPITSNGSVVGVDAYKNLLALTLVPFLITGFSLIFPKPALAFFKAKPQILIISQKVCLMTKAIIKSFLSYDYLDLHIAEFNQLLAEVKTDILLLKQLNKYIINEQMLFYELHSLPGFIDMYLTTVELMLSELQGLRDMVTNIMYNQTQYYFIQQVQSTLVEIQDEMEILLTIVSEFFDLFTVLPEPIRRFLFALYKAYRYCRKIVVGLFRAQRKPGQPMKRKKKRSFYEVPKSVELIETHQKHLQPAEQRFYQSEKRRSLKKQRSSGIGENTNVHSFQNTELDRGRTESVEEFGFHQYHLIGDKSTQLHEEANDKQLQADRAITPSGPVEELILVNEIGIDGNGSDSKERRKKVEIVETGTTYRQINEEEGTDEEEEQQEEEPRYDSKRHLFHLLQLQFEQTLAKLLHTRGKLLFQFQQIRKSYIYFDPNILPHFPDDHHAPLPPPPPPTTAAPSSPSPSRTPRSASRKRKTSDASMRRRAASSQSGDSRDEIGGIDTPASGTSLINKVQTEIVMLEEREHSRHLLLSIPPTSTDPDAADDIFLEEEAEENSDEEGNERHTGDEAKRGLLAHTQKQPSQRGKSSFLTTSTNLPPHLTSVEDDEEAEKLLQATLRQQMQNHPELVQLTVKEEIIRLSLKNLGPRGAYFHRLSILVEYLSSFQIIIQQAEMDLMAASAPSSLAVKMFTHYYSCLADTIRLYLTSVFQYGKSVVDIFVFLGLFLHFQMKRLSLLRRDKSSKNEGKEGNKGDVEKGEKSDKADEKEKPSVISPSRESNGEKKEDIQYDILTPLMAYLQRTTQSYKLALAVTIASLLPIYNVFPSLLSRGFWTALVVALIRQENISSSFVMSYQRLEGTVIGSIFSFIAYEIFQCNEDGSNTFCIQQFGVRTIVLILWLFVCGLFRDGELHGYSATVAGFTPFVLLLNPNYLGLEVAFARIEETFIGIVIYLAVDILIFPQRIYPKVKGSVLNCIMQCRSIVNDTIQAVEIVMKFEEFAIREKLESSAIAGTEVKAGGIEEPSKRSIHNPMTSHPPVSVLPSIEESKTSNLSASSSPRPPPVLIPSLEGLNTSSQTLSNQPKVSPRAGGASPPSRSPGNSFENRVLEDSSTYGDFVQVRYRTSSLAAAVSSNPPLPLLPPTKRQNSFSTPSVRGSPSSSSRKYSDVTTAPPPTKAVKQTTDSTVEPSEESPSQSPREKAIEDLYHQCTTFLDQGDKQLQNMKEELTKQADYLKTIVYEPNLFFYQFPYSSYDHLHSKFQNVFRSSLALNHGSRTLIILIVQMLMKKEDHIIQQLNHLLYMIKHLFLITNKSELALTSAYEAFQKLYDEHDVSVNLHCLLRLRRICEKLLESTEDHFRKVYIRQPSRFIGTINPYFVVAWQNVFESASDLVHDLSELGMALHIVRNVEATQYTT